MLYRMFEVPIMCLKYSVIPAQLFFCQYQSVHNLFILRYKIVFIFPFVAAMYI